jgi:L-threonylcarbamoyladenylate synthase
MRTERLRVGFAPHAASNEASAQASIERAAEVLRGGGLVAFPTETVYGLGARADQAEAVRRIFVAKGRPPGNPLIVHVRSAEDAALLCASWPEEAERLASAFWPGPLTIIAARRPDRVASEAAAGGLTVGIRVPAHPVARALLDACALPVAAPSANQSTSISPTTADHVMKSLGGRIDMVLDGGPTGYGIESTIVDVTVNPVVILRHGAIPLSAIEALVPAVDRAGATVDPSQRARAPGAPARPNAPPAPGVRAPA